MWEAIVARRQAWPFAVFFTAVFVLLFLLNRWTPTWGDDWYRTVPLADLGQMFGRIRDEYLTWTGRSSVLATTFVMLAIWPGSLLLFDLLNSAVFCLLLAALFRIAAGHWPGAARTDLLTLFVALIACWFGTQSFGEAVLWKTGAIAYLWVMVAALLFVMPWLDLLLAGQTRPGNRWRNWLWPLGAFWLGMALENVSVVLVLLVALVLMLNKPLQLPRWYLGQAGGLLAGALALFLAPGNAVRFAMQDDRQPIAHRLGELLLVIWQHVSSVTPLLAVLIALLLAAAIRRDGEEAGPMLRRSWVLLVLGTLLALAMVGSTGINFGTRTAFPAEVFWIAALLALAHPLWARGWQLVWHLPLFAILGGVFAADALTVLEQGKATQQQTARREALMAQYRQQGLRRIVLPSLQIPYLPQIVDDYTQGRYFLRDIHGDTPGNGWRNGTYAEDHGFEFAIRLPQPWLVYLPELARERILASGPDHLLLLRQEAHGWRTAPSLYLLMTREACQPQLSVRWRAASPEVLPRMQRQQGFVEENLAYRDEVAVVDAGGMPTGQFCAWRLPVPDYATQISIARSPDPAAVLEISLPQ
ncbi:DUF6056 family protein [Chitinilyticum litopenaei]|uniref:DUF6056 family protein n=1 Tax=Chitinilyticum litopenaei TaxID=1121276 RepID=UPI0003F6B09E|nr:DUF6056 family protein [Chitinilyticum litopenaei]